MDMILPSFVVINSYFDGLSSPSNCKLDNSMFPKKMFLKLLQNLKEKPVPQDCNFIIKQTPAQVFSCEFCECFQKTVFTEHFRVIAYGMNISHF